MYVVPGRALVVALLAAGVGVQSAAAQSVGAVPKMEDVFKNIKVLQGAPAEQLGPTMQFISASLGVGCNHCHDEDDRDLDVKEPKETAREMMRMVFAMNKDSFDSSRKVTCYICHRSNAKPVGLPLVAGEELSQASEPEEEKEATTAGLPSAEELLARYVAALGGEAALGRISSRVEKGTLIAEQPGRPPSRVPVEIYEKTPALRAVVTHQKNGDATEAFDGSAGWVQSAGGRAGCGATRPTLPPWKTTLPYLPFPNPVRCQRPEGGRQGNRRGPRDVCPYRAHSQAAARETLPGRAVAAARASGVARRIAAGRNPLSGGLRRLPKSRRRNGDLPAEGQPGQRPRFRVRDGRSKAECSSGQRHLYPAGNSGGHVNCVSSRGSLLTPGVGRE